MLCLRSIVAQIEHKHNQWKAVVIKPDEIGINDPRAFPDYSHRRLNGRIDQGKR